MENTKRLAEIIENKRLQEAATSLSIEDQEVLEVIRSLFPSAPLFALRDDTYLRIEGIFDVLIRIKTGGRIQYALLPGNIDDYEAIDMRLIQSEQTEQGYVREMFNAPVDFNSLEAFLSKKIAEDAHKALTFEKE